ncbi:lys-63-specific deubiquitinase BRCC36-like [Penaeus chinensis]|uniref:lys-63-specific deubiquitinase BRCC36-like n=1 Tax=Penaeus chinensis TaxID=139456 RepID=UPI001FB5E052|nr:lys-63-specific deubiquitinase BRCC36-like [Penaeus chinensis]XP_047501153.1 lys-63-specific deubiquitinase BRCC36-like [Penaeus chinensis]
MWVSSVRLAADAYLVCLHHALTTEKEEVMGLLVGQFSEGNEVTCDIYSAVTLRRSDKRKDRVEISPEMLIEAQNKAEQMSASSGQELHIVGWYHSHPHITVWPSDIDLQTQAGYQQMDSRFIGLIFSVYNEDKKTKVGSHQVTCFQATNQSPEGEAPQYVRLPVPLEIQPTPNLAPNNQQALESLCSTLFDEQSEVLELSRQRSPQYPLAHLHNAAVMVRSVCGLSSLVSGPLVCTMEERLHHIRGTTQHLKQEAEYLKNLLLENEIKVPL